MSVKSIYEVDVQSPSFALFQERFKKYQEALKNMPAAWAKVGAATEESATHIQSIVAAMMAHADLAKHLADQEKRRRKIEEDSAFSWGKIARSSKDVFSTVTRTTASLLKWVGIGGIVGGLLGAGGLWGIDTLANRVGSGRRGALGLGVVYGEAQSFKTNFARLVDPDAFLGGVNTALTDVSQRWSLYGAGLHEDQLKGKDTAQVGAMLIPYLKNIADHTPTAMLGQLLQARGLGNLGVSVQDLERLKNTSPAEIAGLIKAWQADQKTLGLRDDTAKRWQDLDTQLSRAGAQIENVFVRGLEPLVPAFTALSGSVVKGLTELLSDPKLKDDITSFGYAIEGAAKYIASGQFTTDIHTFVDDVHYAANKMVSVMATLGLLPDRGTQVPKTSATKGKVAVHSGGSILPFLGAQVDFAKDLATGNVSRAYGTDLKNSWDRLLDWNAGAGNVDNVAINNPLNLRPVGGKGYMTFPTMAQGIAADAHQLLIDRYKHGQRSIADIIGDPRHGWAPAGADHNHTDNYIRYVAKAVGVPANADIDLSNAKTLSRLIRAMSKFEGTEPVGASQVDPVVAAITALKGKGGSQSPHKVVVTVDNNTGGNAVVTSSQLRN
jgi:hypothetical protein